MFLNAGTYTIGSPGITFNGKSDITVRGAGANSTFLNFTSGSSSACGMGTTTQGAGICIGSTTTPYMYGGQNNTTTWTAGYTQGAMSITLSSKMNLQVGAMLLIGQAWDSADTGNVYICHGATCTDSGGSDNWGPGREQGQMVTVTSISAGACPCTIGITPGLRMPNWRSGQTPSAVWGTGLPISGSGVENLSMNFDNLQAHNGVMFNHATSCWLKGVRSVNPGATSTASHHVKLLYTTHITVRDSYFWGGKHHQSESYGVDTVDTSDDLIENNIFQYISEPIVNESSVGAVFAYNYSIDDFFGDGSWAMMAWWTHAVGNHYLLFESNDGYGLALDNYHGASAFTTAFRNRMTGFESGNLSQTVPAFVNAFSRYNNFVGNVLGTSGYHTNYQKRAGIDSQDVGTCYHSIWAIGWGSGCDTVSPKLSDSLTVSTLLRWGNYDVVNAATRFVSTEVPSGIALYANAVPATQTLPGSFYLLSKPAFFGTQPWPSIGPDVTGGTDNGVGGHNAKIPARRCFEDVMNGTFGQRTAARTFDAGICYGASGGGGADVTPPSAPKNLVVLP